MREPLPIACTLDSGQLDDRSAEWRHLVESGALGREEIPGGIRLEFARSALGELRRLVRLEAECCPWMEMTLSAGDPASLLITAPPDGVAILAEMFQLQ